MKSLRLALVLLGIVALLSIGLAQGKSDTAKGKMMDKKPTNAKAVKARHHGKMVVKVKGKGMSKLAKHHGVMTKEGAAKRRRHHRRMRRHHGTMHRHMTMKSTKMAAKKGDGDNDKDDMKKKGK